MYIPLIFVAAYQLSSNVSRKIDEEDQDSRTT